MPLTAILTDQTIHQIALFASVAGSVVGWAGWKTLSRGEAFIVGLGVGLSLMLALLSSR